MLSFFKKCKDISFCISCKDRFPQISQTLPKNLADNYGDRSSVEFLLVDLGSKDELQNWILNNFRHFIRLGYLRYIFTDELSHWHMSRAKNTAHLHASGSILVNLDCDNFTGKLGARFVKKCFAQSRDEVVLHQFSGVWRDGSCGRISLRKELFYKVGGYDESFEPMGHQDIDLLLRLQHSGVRYVREQNENYNAAIKNTKEESLRFCNSRLSWEEMRTRNEKTSATNIASKQFIANGGTFGIRTNLFEHDGNDFKPLLPTK